MPLVVQLFGGRFGRQSPPIGAVQNEQNWLGSVTQVLAPAQHCPNGQGGVQPEQTPLTQCWPLGQATQVAPPEPQLPSLWLAGCVQTPFWQQPSWQLAASQFVHWPLTGGWPLLVQTHCPANCPEVAQLCPAPQL